VIDGASCLVLPLVHHLVQQRLNRFIPSMPPDVTPADHDLGRMARLPAQCVVTEPRLHSA